MRVPLAIAVSVIVASTALYWTGKGTLTARAAGINSVDIVAGERVYSNYCAACHGANLEGQEDWRSPGEDGRLPAPPHDETGHTWHHSDRLLFDYTKLGGAALLAQKGVEFDSGMPGFAEQLTDAEIHNVIAYIKSTWPERIQKIQADRSKAEEQRD